MTNDFEITTPYIPGEKGCRFTWIANEDDEKTLYMRHEDLMKLTEMLNHDSTGKIEMEDAASSILINSDSTDFFPAGQIPLKIETLALKIALKEFLINNPDS